MARRTATSYRNRGTQVTVTDTTDPKVVVVEKEGWGLAEALTLATTIMLLAAILMTDAYLGKRYGAGIFF